MVLMDFDRKNIGRIGKVIRQSRLPNFKQSEGRFQNFTTATMEESSPSVSQEEVIRLFQHVFNVECTVLVKHHLSRKPFMVATFYNH